MDNLLDFLIPPPLWTIYLKGYEVKWTLGIGNPSTWYMNDPFLKSYPTIISSEAHFRYSENRVFSNFWFEAKNFAIQKRFTVLYTDLRWNSKLDWKADFKKPTLRKRGSLLRLQIKYRFSHGNWRYASMMHFPGSSTQCFLRFGGNLPFLGNLEFKKNIEILRG